MLARLHARQHFNELQDWYVSIVMQGTRIETLMDIRAYPNMDQTLGARAAVGRKDGGVMLFVFFSQPTAFYRCLFMAMSCCSVGDCHMILSLGRAKRRSDIAEREPTGTEAIDGCTRS